jgi:MFS family permease
MHRVFARFLQHLHAVGDLPQRRAGEARHRQILRLADPGLRGRYLAVYQLSWTVGQTAAPGLLTLLLGYGAPCPWLFLGALSLVAVPALLLLERCAGA